MSEKNVMDMLNSHINKLDEIKSDEIKSDEIKSDEIKNISLVEDISLDDNLKFDFDIKQLHDNVDPISINLDEKIINLDKEDNQSKKPLSRLRVDELRELVVTKSLKSNDEALKLKKTELIKLLEN